MAIFMCPPSAIEGADGRGVIALVRLGVLGPELGLDCGMAWRGGLELVVVFMEENVKVWRLREDMRFRGGMSMKQWVAAAENTVFVCRNHHEPEAPGWSPPRISSSQSAEWQRAGSGKIGRGWRGRTCAVCP
jgi:hypothetical protein